jgi:hypothetical protein
MQLGSHFQQYIFQIPCTICSLSTIPLRISLNPEPSQHDITCRSPHPTICPNPKLHPFLSRHWRHRSIIAHMPSSYKYIFYFQDPELQHQQASQELVQRFLRIQVSAGSMQCPHHRFASYRVLYAQKQSASPITSQHICQQKSCYTTTRVPRA